MKTKGQTKTQSLVESVSHTVVGYLVAVALQVVLYPWYHIELSLSNEFGLAMWFTGASFIRGYIMRRFFNWLFNKGNV